jgi:hypothetical protein
MGDAEELNLLRETYERELASYEAVCLSLNRRLLAGKPPTPEDMQRERAAKAALDTARRAYLSVWARDGGV